MEIKPEIKEKGENMNTAIVLSAGRGTRMGSSVPKQYLELNGKPVLVYCLEAFENSSVEDIVIVAGADDTDYVKREIVDKYGITKVKSIVSGGKYRFESVEAGLDACAPDTKYVFIHDGARPLITPEMIEELDNEVKTKKAVIASCKVKDTIKVADEEGKVCGTPERESLRQVQTPQVFEYTLIKNAYNKRKDADDKTVTDDAMTVEKYTDVSVYLVDTGDGNIKITTPFDMQVAEAVLRK